MKTAAANKLPSKSDLDLEWLLKVRTAVARVGEMDLARWWNSNGQLGPQGALVLRRGLPQTHHFAQARSVFTVAAARCAQIFDPPGTVTPWRLTDPLEERLETLWEGWLDDAKSWHPFFERIAAIKAADLPACLTDLELVTADEVAATRSLKKSTDGRSMRMLAAARRSRCWPFPLATVHPGIWSCRMRGGRTHEAPPRMVPAATAKKACS
jgi:hypothetical protein